MILFNGLEITKSYFSNTEVRLNALYLRSEVSTLELKYETENPFYKINDDLICLYFVKQYLRQNYRNAELILWSMPYQRMDHKSGNDIHTLPYVAKFINDLEFSKVLVIEPHSDKTAEYLDDKAKMIYVVPKILDIAIYSYCDFDYGTDKVQILFPDKGAHSRYADKIENIFDVCVFTKRRDNVSNEIVQHELESGNIKKGSTCFILDDICSSGQTLLDVAYFAKMSGAAKVYVVVAHCENKALEGELLKPSSHVDMMFTTKSMISCKHPKITYIVDDLLS